MGRRRRFGPALNPEGICRCGCGTPTGIARSSGDGRGLLIGHPREWAQGHAPGLRERTRPEDHGHHTLCLTFLGAKSDRGYGREWWAPAGKVRAAHTNAWEQANGPVPEGLEIHHECRNRACVNPEHLATQTHREHMENHHGWKKVGA